MPRQHFFPLNIYRLTNTKAPMDSLVSTKATSTPIVLTGLNEAKLYFKEQRIASPKWKKLVSTYIKEEVGRSEFEKLGNSSAGMVLIVDFYYETERVRYALSYGTGHFLLLNEHIDERFGLKSALNAATNNKIKSIDYKSYSNNYFNHRTQAGNATDILECGIDSNGDFLCSITCDIDKGYGLGKKATGKDKLGLSLPYSMDGISDLLVKVEELYRQTTYQKNYGWVDNLVEISNKSTIDDLNDRLIKIIHNRKMGEANLLLMVPDIIDYGEVSSFVYSCNRQLKFEDIDIQDYLNTKVEIPTLSDLKKDKLCTLDDSGMKKSEWSIWKCLYGELSFSKFKYVLQKGKWFQVDHIFTAALDSDIAAIPSPTCTFVDWKKSWREDDYNKYLQETMK